MSKKKAEQLGEHHSNARGRLIIDLLFSLAVGAGHKCFRCGGDFTRQTFSIDHKIDWLDSAEPIRLYFDISNIAFSHLSCNKQAPRKEVTDGRARSPQVKEYMRKYYQEKIKGRSTPEFRERRRVYMRSYNDAKKISPH